MTSEALFSIMRLFVFLVLLVDSIADAHLIWPQESTIHYVSNAAIVPTSFYTIHHAPGVVPVGGGAVSRETLEEHSGEGIQQELLPDISDEQAHLDPDDSQIPTKPFLPPLPRPQPSLPRPHLPVTPRPTQPPAILPPVYPIPSRPGSPPSDDPGIVFNGPRPDGSYDFSYNQPDQSRSEKGDSQGGVEGTYSYTGPDGKVVTITYSAGAGKGYIPAGEGLLPPPQPTGGEGHGVDDSQIASKPHLPRVAPRPVLPPPRPILPKPSPRGSPPSSNDPGIVFNGPRPDGSYDFSYSQDDQSRSETGDSQGGVEGSYSYTGTDGKVVTVTYSAGAGKGYVPVGEGLLPPPRPSGGHGKDGDDPYSIPSGGHDGSGQRPIQPDGDDGQHQIPSSGGEEENHKGMPYNYNYEAHASGKAEVADDNGHVKGSYWYIDGAGSNRTVSYTVNGEEGFIAKEDISPGTGSTVKGSSGVNPQPPIKGGSGGRPRPGGDVPTLPVSPSRKGPPPSKGGVPPTLHGKGIGPVSGVKGGSKGGSGWDKYPLGK